MIKGLVIIATALATAYNLGRTNGRIGYHAQYVQGYMDGVNARS